MMSSRMLHAPWANDWKLRSRRGVGPGVAMLLATVAVVAGCGGSSGSSSTGSTATGSTATGSSSTGSTSTGTAAAALTIGIVPSNVPTSLNPALTSGAANEDIYVLAYSPILHISANGSYGPALATSWGYVGKDNTQFMFTLRQNAKFSDGSPVNAAAVVKWLKYFSGAGGGFAGQLGSVASITTTSTYTVDIKLNAPNPAIEWELSQTNGLGYVASPNAIAAPNTLSRNTFGAGPYVLDSAQTVPNSTYVYTPNKYYYDQAAIHFKKITLKVISNQSTMLEALQSGQIDVATGDYTTAPQAQSAGFDVISGRTSWEGLVFPTLGAPGNPLNNTAVRQAMSYAINRPEITTALLGKYGTPTSEWVTTDGYDPAYADHYPYDPAKAKSLLSSAGFAHGVTISVLDFAGTLQDGTPGDGLVQVVAQQLAAVGIKLNITTVPASQVAQLFSGKYEMGAAYFGINPTAIYWNLFVAPNAPVNLKHWSGDPQATQLFEAGVTATNPSADFIATSRRLTDIGYPLPIYTPLSLVYAKKTIGGISFPILPNGIANGTFPDPTQFYAK